MATSKRLNAARRRLSELALRPSTEEIADPQEVKADIRTVLNALGDAERNTRLAGIPEAPGDN